MAQFVPKSAHVAQFAPTSDQIWPKSGRLRPSSPKFGRTRPEFGPIWAIPGQTRTTSAEMGAKSDRNRSNVGRTPPNVRAKFGRFGSEVGLNWTEFRRVDQVHDDLAQEMAAKLRAFLRCQRAMATKPAPPEHPPSPAMRWHTCPRYRRARPAFGPAPRWL